VFHLPIYFDYPATFLWAVSGAILAARRGYDIAGIFAIALVSATGGGLLRDGFFLQGGPPALVRTPIYLELVAAGTLLVIFVGRKLHRTDLYGSVIRTADAFGLGAYAVVGMQLAASKGLSAPALCLIGVINAVGGGVLRDVLLHREPEVFRPGTLASVAALAGCLLYLLLTDVFHADPSTAGWSAVVLTFIIRFVSIYLRLETRPVRGIYEPQSEAPGENFIEK
jgi:uncharacterized membrane protein YeiH